MKKELQRIVNDKVLLIKKAVDNELIFCATGYHQLRRCQAHVIKTAHFYVLQSYNSIVAAIDADGNLYDFLRCVHGYSATSAQHIAKFYNDYAQPIANLYNDYALHGARYTYCPL